MNKKILILGVNGLLGTNIYNFLKNKKLTVYTCTRKKNKNFDNNFVYGNLLKKNSEKRIKKIIKKINPQYIINCTGITKHKKSTFIKMKKINYDLVYKILLLKKNTNLNTFTLVLTVSFLVKRVIIPKLLHETLRIIMV
mgnify:CR=1 FL=1